MYRCNGKKTSYAHGDTSIQYAKKRIKTQNIKLPVLGGKKTTHCAHGESIRLPLKRSVGVSTPTYLQANLRMLSTVLSVLHPARIAPARGLHQHAGWRAKDATRSSEQGLSLILPVRERRPRRQIARAAGMRRLEGRAVARRATALVVFSGCRPESSLERGALAAVVADVP